MRFTLRVMKEVIEVEGESKVMWGIYPIVEDSNGRVVARLDNSIVPIQSDEALLRELVGELRTSLNFPDGGLVHELPIASPEALKVIRMWSKQCNKGETHECE
jgi:hypothetical protein